MKPSVPRGGSSGPGEITLLGDGGVARPRPQADAAERDFDRMAAWMAQHDDVYGFGTTTGQVVSYCNTGQITQGCAGSPASA